MATEQPKRSFHVKAMHFRALINREGTFNVHGHRAGFRNPLGDLYHYFFSLSWPKFFLHIASLYALVNLTFACLYYVLGVDILSNGNSPALQRFGHCLMLSIENLSAVEYGRVGPDSTAVYTLMGAQAFWGILTLAMITGLFYARFSRPTARVIFSNKAVVGPHNGRRCLHFRIANERLNRIAEAHISLHLTKNEVSLEGEHTRKFYDLKLERENSPLFALSWTVRHYIDKDSPLYEMDHAKMEQQQIGLLASLSGTDETFAQPIMARHAYAPGDIAYNMRFKDIIVWENNKIHINLKDIHDLEPQAAHSL